MIVSFSFDNEHERQLALRDPSLHLRLAISEFCSWFQEALNSGPAAERIPPATKEARFRLVAHAPLEFEKVPAVDEE